MPEGVPVAPCDPGAAPGIFVNELPIRDTSEASPHTVEKERRIASLGVTDLRCLAPLRGAAIFYGRPKLASIVMITAIEDV